MMTKKQMEELTDMIVSKIIVELFGDAKIALNLWINLIVIEEKM